MKIRSYKEKDNIYLGKIYDLCRPDEFYAEKEEQKVVPWFDEPFIQDNIGNTNIVVCEVENSVVAFCGWRNNHIYWLFVLSEFRKKGIARKLLHEAVSSMDGEISLIVWNSNLRAKSLYESYGFNLNDTKIVDYYGKLLKSDKMVFRK